MPLKVDIITPEKLAFSDQADFVVAPAIDGEIGILPHHTPLLTRLGIGELRLKKGDQVISVAVAGGFLEVNHDHVSVFAETAEMSQEIDLERARLAVEHAKSKLAAPQDLTSEELMQVEVALSRAVMRMKVGQVRRQPQSNLHR